MNLTDTIVDERPDFFVQKPEVIKRQTRLIARNSEFPIITSIHGTWMNPHCYVREAYSLQYLRDKISTQ